MTPAAPPCRPRSFIIPEGESYTADELCDMACKAAEDMVLDAKHQGTYPFKRMPRQPEEEAKH